MYPRPYFEQHQPVLTMPSSIPSPKPILQKKLMWSSTHWKLLALLITFLHESLNRKSTAASVSGSLFLSPTKTVKKTLGGNCNNLEEEKVFWGISHRCSAYGARITASRAEMWFMACSPKAMGTWGKERKFHPWKKLFSLEMDGWEKSTYHRNFPNSHSWGAAMPTSAR